MRLTPSDIAKSSAQIVSCFTFSEPVAANSPLAAAALAGVEPEIDRRSVIDVAAVLDDIQVAQRSSISKQRYQSRDGRGYTKS